MYVYAYQLIHIALTYEKNWTCLYLRRLYFPSAFSYCSYLSSHHYSRIYGGYDDSCRDKDKTDNNTNKNTDNPF